MKKTIRKIRKFWNSEACELICCGIAMFGVMTFLFGGMIIVGLVG